MLIINVEDLKNLNINHVVWLWVHEVVKKITAPAQIRTGNPRIAQALLLHKYDALPIAPRGLS